MRICALSPPPRDAAQWNHLAGYMLLIVLDRTKPALVFSVVRDAASLTLIVLAYGDMGWRESGNRVDWASHSIDTGDRLRACLCAGAVCHRHVVRHRRREMVDQFLFVRAVGVLLC